MQTKIFSLLFILFTAFSVSVQAQEVTPESWLQVRGEELIKALSNDSAKTRQAQTLRLAENTFNSKELGRLAIGKYWVEFSPEQRERFLSLFLRYFVVSYTSVRLPVDKISFKIEGSVPSGKDVLVKTSVDLSASQVKQEIISPEANQFIPISNGDSQKSFLSLIFALRPEGNGYYIRDVQVEGQSMLLFLRKKLEDDYKSSGYEIDRFLNEMQEKIRTAIINANTLDQFNDSKTVKAP